MARQDHRFGISLLRILATNPEVLVNAKAEAEEREAQEKEEKLRKTYGADYDLVFDQKAKEKANSMVGNNKSRRPGAIQLRTSVPRVAMIHDITDFPERRTEDWYKTQMCLRKKRKMNI